MLSSSKTSGPSGYNLTNSLRFRNSASASLTRTPGSAGNRRTFTWSAWVKRGIINAGTSPHQFLLSASTSTTFCAVDLYSNNIRVNFGNGTYLLVTTQVFRDPSSWYHIVLAVDTTQATDTNRVKLYINGSQVTAFSTAVYPAQNYDTAYNNTVAQRFAVNDATDYFDGYMAEINWVDGQALTPSSFGSTNATTGVWQPAKYTGTYGTNGFYLKFSDIATTSGSNAGLGKDFSGNSNYWTTNNISVTSGTTYDAMTDVPTLTSATVANYCVFNPLDNGGLTISAANLKASTTSTSYYSTRCSMAVPSSGKWYWEYNVTAQDTGIGSWFSIGMATSSVAMTGFIGGVAGCIYYGDRNDSGSAIYNETTTVTSGTGINFATGDVVQIAYDADTGKFWFGKNNSWWNSSGGTTGDPSAGTNQTLTASANTYFPLLQLRIGTSGTNTADINFGQRPFTYTPPTGFVALNTYNLPTPTILQGNKYMDATLYAGNTTTVTATNAGGFKPDLVWIKDRTQLASHVLTDSVRGTTKQLFSNLTNAQQTDSNYVTSFNSNGFTVGTGQSGTGVVNNSGDNFVGWQWQAGQGTTSSNTSGSITSTVSVNTTAGFSIFTFTGTGANATVGHGLGVAPKMVIVKASNDSGRNWAVWHTSIANTQYVLLNSTAAAATDATFWNSTSPTSTTISVGSNVDTNRLGNINVVYAFAEISGFSKFGSYTGNGSTDGPFVYTGFRPKFVMIKRTDAANDWNMYDSRIGAYNVIDDLLKANTSAAETTYYTYYIDFLSNGFKLRETDTGQNASGGTYIFMAFAENPFKNALAR